MKDYKELVAAMCDYCGLDNLYPYENLDEIRTEFENHIDDMANNRILMLIREKKLNDRIKELEVELAKYKK